MGDAARRNRTALALGIVLAAVLGIGSRRYGSALPRFVADYAGDTLWALAAFLFIAWLVPSLATGRVAPAALGLSLLVELSQLYHAPWIDTIRRTPPFGLVLGYDFVPSDLICYAAGVGLGVLFDVIPRGLPRTRRTHPARTAGPRPRHRG